MLCARSRFAALVVACCMLCLGLACEVPFRFDAAPTANAGPDKTVDVGSRVVLDGSASVDPDGDPLTFQWAQIEGPPVELEDAGRMAAAFIPAEEATYVFVLTVTDERGRSSTSTVRITGQKTSPHAPLASAGPDREVRSGQVVQLTARESSDSARDIVAYRWTQLDGPPVELTGGDTAAPRFNAPPVDDSSQLVFLLEVEDSGGNTSSDSVVVTVRKDGPGQFTVLVEVQGEGRVDLPSSVFVEGTELTLNAVAEPGWEFIGWCGDLTSSNANVVLVIDGNKKLTAVFAPEDNLGDSVDGFAVDAGPTQHVALGAIVTLTPSVTGGTSPYTYLWQQVSGPPMTLTGATTATPTVQADAFGEAHFRVTVRDSAGRAVADAVEVEVESGTGDDSPAAGDDGDGLQDSSGGLVVDAGRSQHIRPGETATLNPTITGGTLPYTLLWQQISGPAMTLSNATEANATVRGDNLGKAHFRLTVRDAAGRMVADAAEIEVE